MFKLFLRLLSFLGIRKVFCINCLFLSEDGDSCRHKRECKDTWLKPDVIHLDVCAPWELNKHNSCAYFITKSTV